MSWMGWVAIGVMGFNFLFFGVLLTAYLIEKHGRWRRK